jgi:hypothetical protein
MSVEKSFNDLYQTTLIPALEGLELTRKGVLNRFWIMIVWLLITALIVLFIFVGDPSFFDEVGVQLTFLFLLIFTPIIFLVIAASRYYSNFAKYKATFKGEVILKMIQYLDNDLKYNPESFIPSPEFYASTIFREQIDEYGGSDLIEGNVGETRVRFSELLTQQKRSNGKSTTLVTIFEGIFFIADFNKNFSAHTVILPDELEGLLGSFGKTLETFTIGRGEMIKLESPDFNKNFVVYSTSQQEARYILSPSLMEAIVKFRVETGRKIFLSFCNSNIYIAIPTGGGLFEPMLFSSGLNQYYLKNYFNYLNMCIGIVSELNLNTRIWTKE